MITLNKPRAKQRIEIEEDLKMDPDGWFFKISFIENKTGKLVSEHCVIQKDLDRWIAGFEREGWSIVK